MFPKGSPQKQWAEFLDSVSAIAGLCPVGDWDVIPDSCVNKSSLRDINRDLKDFWAWKFGYVAGKLARIPVAVESVGWSACTGVDDYRPYAAIVQSVLDSNPDGSYSSFSTWLGLAGQGRDEPDMDLSTASPAGQTYWAMRVGFADGMLNKAVAIVPLTGSVEKDILSSIGVRQVKHDLIMNEKLDEMIQNQRILMARSQPSLEEIETYLLETLNDTFDRLQLQVRDHLKQAELDFKSGIRQSNARVEFVKTVEAALDCLFISHLRSYYQQCKLGWPFMAPSSIGTKNEYGIRQWGEHFCKLAQPMSQQLGNINQPGINRFLKENYPKLNYCELEGLGKSLQDVQKLRGGSAHHQNEFPLNKEIEQLKELRKLVLGLGGRPSIIKQIVELFGKQKHP